MGKDLWFAEFERHLNEMEDAGIDPDVAYERAGKMAEKSLRDKLAAGRVPLGAGSIGDAIRGGKLGPQAMFSK